MVHFQIIWHKTTKGHKIHINSMAPIENKETHFHLKMIPSF